MRVQWMAPEVLASEKYTETADVYSFAVVCWELLSRACPYEGMSQIQVSKFKAAIPGRSSYLRCPVHASSTTLRRVLVASCTCSRTCS